jgi:hypothetical protein
MPISIVASYQSYPDIVSPSEQLAGGRADLGIMCSGKQEGVTTLAASIACHKSLHKSSLVRSCSKKEANNNHNNNSIRKQKSWHNPTTNHHHYPSIYSKQFLPIHIYIYM